MEAGEKVMSVQPTGESAEWPIEHVSTRDGYDRWAELYDGDDNPLVALEEPVVREWVGDVRGRSVLDLGCGTGRHALWLANQGARVTAIDFSAAMLDRARSKAGTLEIDFRQHDVGESLPFDNEHFDIVVCGLVVDHIADLGSFFQEMRRVLRPGGHAVVSTVHPAMMLRGVQARFRDPNSGREVRPASCSHQLSDYVLAADRASFQLSRLGEFAVGESLADCLERARKYLGWPLLFVMKLGWQIRTR